MTGGTVFIDAGADRQLNSCTGYAADENYKKK
jgi:hypothetical protein